MPRFGPCFRPVHHQRVQRLPIGLHANVAIVFEPLLRDMARDVHNGLFACSAFRQLGCQGMAVIVPSALHAGLFAEAALRDFQLRHVARWFGSLGRSYGCPSDGITGEPWLSQFAATCAAALPWCPDYRCANGAAPICFLLRR
jgi:hypothetical protein